MISSGSRGDIGGNVSVTAGRDVNMSGGSGTGTGQYAYTMIGNGGEQRSSTTTGNLSGNITVDALRYLVMYGTGYGDFAQIGNGGGQEESAAQGTTTGNITVTVGNASTPSTDTGNNLLTGNVPSDPSGSIIMDSTSNTDEAYVQIGHGGVNDQSTQGAISGNITVTSTQNLLLISSFVCGSSGSTCLPTADTAYLQIGHGGLMEHGGTPPSITNSTLTVSAYQINTQGSFQ
ncbi:MAG TPA: hypothetical protein PLD79_07205, partial [Halothiobacillus sp.]|nr:hypothetical protein [Halothiobacillus sp.]